VAESACIEGAGRYYEETVTLRDMVQNHEVPGYRTRNASRRTQPSRRSWRCASRSTTCAARTFRSSCGRASACRTGRRRSRSSGASRSAGDSRERRPRPLAGTPPGAPHPARRGDPDSIRFLPPCRSGPRQLLAIPRARGACRGGARRDLHGPRMRISTGRSTPSQGWRRVAVRVQYEHADRAHTSPTAPRTPRARLSPAGPGRQPGPARVRALPGSLRVA
jgi:hypothetical protein